MLKRSLICLVTCSLLIPTLASQDDDFEAFMRTHSAELESFEAQRLAEFDRFIAAWQAAETAFRAELAQYWQDVELSSRTRYVEYSEDRHQRTIIDYETNQVILETKHADVSHDDSGTLNIEKVEDGKGAVDVDDNSTDGHMQARDNTRTLVQTVLNDLSHRTVAEAIESDPVYKKARLEPPRRLNDDATLLTKSEIELEANDIEVSRSGSVTRITIQLPTPLASLRANEALPQVRIEAERWRLPPALVLAIIHTESSFNPLARSPIPAFGLMQIVPQTAGRDVTEFMRGEQQVLMPDYLYDPRNNIEAGSVYLHLLFNRYFAGIDEQQSRWYLTIAAYNTGPGNVARTLTGERRLDAARVRANEMTVDELYDYLVTNLPAQETRTYLKKVTERQHFYNQQLGLSL